MVIVSMKKKNKTKKCLKALEFNTQNTKCAALLKLMGGTQPQQFDAHTFCLYQEVRVLKVLIFLLYVYDKFYNEKFYNEITLK